MTEAVPNTTQILTEQPKIILTEIGEADVRGRMAELNREIHKNPEGFQSVLKSLGEFAMQGTVTFDLHDALQSKTDRSPQKLLTETFVRGDDKKIEFDESTEHALDIDPKHQQLLKEHLALRSRERAVKKGDEREDQKAAKSVEATRLSRVATLIDRSIVWKKQKLDARAQRDTLSSAS
ncbi:MAG: hypothetical protein ABI602_02410 [Candidatus Saccharibacteria bacterium]